MPALLKMTRATPQITLANAPLAAACAPVAVASAPIPAANVTFATLKSRRIPARVTLASLQAAALVVALFLWATPAARAQTGQWTQLSVQGPTPVARAWHAMAFDSTRNVTVLFGGGNFDRKGDTWEFDGQSWTLKATTGPSPRANVSMAFDSARNVCVIFSGSPMVAGDTWEWNGSAWTQRTFTGPTPSMRNDHVMAYDSARGVVVLHGGGSSVNTNAPSETWEYNGIAWTLKAQANGPSRATPAMVYDSDRAVCVMFGGQGPGDVWTYDGTTWVQHPAVTGPSTRFYTAMAYDPIRKVCVIHGGNNNGVSQPGTFEWNGASWRELPVGGRGAWQGDRMVFDTARNQIVSFGGTFSGAATDQSTWVLQTLRPIILGSYDASLGTLPSAQGWTLEEIGAASPPYSVGGGELRQGPTSPNGNQGWGIDNAQADFASQAGQVFELDARVVASTFDPNGSGPGNWRAGFTLLIVDRNLRLVSLGLTNSGLVVSTDRNFALSASVSVPLDTTSAFRRYRVAVNSTGARVFVDGVLAASLGVPQPTFLITPKAYFGDLSTGSCEVRIRSVRWGTLGATVPLAAAGPNDNSYFTGTRPDPGSGATTTYNVGTFTVETGSSWTLGSGEILNAPGGLVVQPGAVLIANGTINGPLVNNGLLIIPITQASLISRVVPGPSRGVIIVPVPRPTPGVPPTPIPVPLPNPPVIEPGEIIVISGSGPGAGPSGGGGGGGGSPGGGGTVRLITPSLPIQGTIRLDSLLEVTGPITQSATGITRLFIAGTTRGQTYSALDSGQTISLDGGIQVVLRPEMFGYTPSIGDTFDVMYAPGGITLPDGSIELSTFLTPSGATALGLTLPPYLSPFPADPDTLVQFPSSLFSYSIVNGGTTLRLTMVSPACGPVNGPGLAAICPAESAQFSVSALGSGPFNYRWQVENPVAPGQWLNLSDGLMPGLGTFSGTSGATLTVSLVARASSNYRCVVDSPCAQVTSSIATLIVQTTCSPADLADSDGLTTLDGRCPDGTIDNGDFTAFFFAFFADVADPFRAAADIANTDGETTLDGVGPDGVVDNGDFTAFFALFFQGCPN